MSKVINFNQDNSSAESFNISFSDELKAEAQALNDYIMQLNLSCEDNNRLISMVFTHMKNIAKEIFEIGVDVGIDLITDSDTDE